MPSCSCSSGDARCCRARTATGLGERPQRADGHRAVVGVRAEDRVRVAVLAPDESMRVELRSVGDGLAAVGGRLGHDAPIAARRAPSGIDSQVGRLRAS